MTAVRRGLTICLLALVALATGSARAERPAAKGELVEVVVSLSQKPLGDDELARGTPAADPHARKRADKPRAAHRDRGPGRTDPLALPPGRERDGRRPPPLPARPAHLAPGRRERLLERPLPAAARSQPAADRCSRPLGPRAHERRPGDEDRDHRRGDRPDAPVLLAGRVHDARRVSQGPDGLHDGEGDRRARVPAREPGLEERVEAVRPRAVLTRDARRWHRCR